MRLLIVSHTPHYRQENMLVGWGPTVREIDHLATLFDRITHVAPLYTDAPPRSALPYQSSRIRVRPLPPAGGNQLVDKLDILTKTPAYLRAIGEELQRADVVHVRCPANVSLLAIVLMTVARRPKARWIKYAGNWRPTSSDSWSYRFQRWWLHRNLARGWVTINGAWPDQKAHEVTFPNPSLTWAEVETGQSEAAQKQLQPPVRTVFVGRLEEAKGPQILLQAIRQLRAEGLAIEADVIGAGADEVEIKESAEDMARAGSVRFHGWLPRDEVPAFLKQAHFIVLPSAAEGWPKVLSEGMAYGAVPIATAVSAIPHYLQSGENAWLLQRPEAAEVTAGLKWFLASPDRWTYCQQNALRMATQFTYEYYLDQVKRLIVKDRPSPKK